MRFQHHAVVCVYRFAFASSDYVSRRRFWEASLEVGRVIVACQIRLFILEITSYLIMIGVLLVSAHIYQSVESITMAVLFFLTDRECNISVTLPDIEDARYTLNVAVRFFDG